MAIHTEVTFLGMPPLEGVVRLARDHASIIAAERLDAAECWVLVESVSRPCRGFRARLQLATRDGEMLAFYEPRRGEVHSDAASAVRAAFDASVSAFGVRSSPELLSAMPIAS